MGSLQVLCLTSLLFTCFNHDNGLINCLYLCVFYCSPDKSYCICGPNFKGVVGHDDLYETKSSFGVQVVQVIVFVGTFCSSFAFFLKFCLFLG